MTVGGGRYRRPGLMTAAAGKGRRWWLVGAVDGWWRQSTMVVDGGYARRQQLMAAGGGPQNFSRLNCWITRTSLLGQKNMAKSTAKDAHALIQSLRSAYAATPTNLKIIDLYVIFAVSTALIQVAYMALVGSFPFNSFLSGVLSCVGTAVLAVCLRIQVNKENKDFKDLPPERAFADFVLCNLVLHLVIMNFLG